MTITEESIAARLDAARPFYAENGLNAETYDARTGGFPGEIDFYVNRATASGGPVLEIASGTGRVSWPIARAGVPIVGLDLAPAMLRVAESKRAAESDAVNARVRLVRGDMTEFALDERFALAIIPFRAFQVLSTPDAQRKALACIRRHLLPNGRLIIDVFDPRLDLILPGRVARVAEMPSIKHPVSGNIVSIDFLERVNDTVAQHLVERWRFTARTADGEIVRQEIELLELRWSYRFEMMHLLELSGFAVEAEFSDFLGGAPAYGKEQLWVARRA